MEYHPLADLFPLLEGDEFRELCEDIAANGQRVPIVRHEGKILDGRNRYRACKEAGVKPRMVDLPEGVDAKAFVLSVNLHRRHLTRESRQQLVAKLRSEGKSHREIAETLNVPRATVARDLAGAPSGAPETVVGRDGKTYPAAQTRAERVGQAEPTPFTLPEREPGDDSEAIERAEAEEKAKPKNGAPLFDWRKFETRWGEVVRSLDELGRAYPNEKSSQEFAECQRHLGDFYRTWQQWQHRLTRSK